MSTYINAITQVSITLAAATSNTATVNVTSANSFPIFQGFSATGASTDAATSSPRITFSISAGVMTITATLNSSGSCVVNCVVIDPTASLVTGVQAGTIAVSNPASATATITSVSTTLSAVFFLGLSSQNTGSGFWSSSGSCSLTLTNATTVTAAKPTASAQIQTVSFVVVTFAAGALNSNVQKFAVTKTTSTTNTQAVTSVTAANTMLAWGGCQNPGSAFNTFPWITLTNGTTVTLTSGTTANFICNFTVIEFVSGVLKSSQYGSVAISSSTSGTATPGTAVTAANSFCCFLGETGAGTTDATTNTRLTLTNGTPTVTANVTTSSSPTVGFGLNEFNAGGPFPHYTRRNMSGGMITMAGGLI